MAGVEGVSASARARVSAAAHGLLRLVAIGKLEVFLACGAAVLAVAASFAVAPGLQGLAGAALGLVAVAIALVDWRLFIIPNELNILAGALGLANVVGGHADRWAWAALDSFIRATAMLAVFFAFRVAYRLWRGRQGMGLGDVKLAAVAGIWLDWPVLPFVVDIAALSALGFVLARRLFASRELDRSEKLPFGTFLAPAIWICWFYTQGRG